MAVKFRSGTTPWDGAGCVAISNIPRRAFSKNSKTKDQDGPGCGQWKSDDRRSAFLETHGVLEYSAADGGVVGESEVMGCWGNSGV